MVPQGGKDSYIRTSVKAHTLLTNLSYVILAQGVSLLLSVMMSLVVPKALGVSEFGYWQLFLLYAGFVGFFHFGLNDGIYLRFGGTSYSELDHRSLGSQFWLAIAGQSLIALGVLFYALLWVDDPARRFVLMSTAVFLVLNNANNYLCFIFQLSNRAKVYSLSIVANKIFFLICVILLLLLRERSFIPFVVWYLFAQLLGLGYVVVMARKIVFTQLISITKALLQIWINIKVGINLMVSNVADLLVLSVGRFAIDSGWGIATFGRVSFALSLTSFFILFISQVSVVFFPALRLTDSENQKRYFRTGREVLGVLLVGILLAYFPMRVLLVEWLPQYRTSLIYLVILLPLCTYDGKMQLLCATYLKVLRRERTLLLINVGTCALSVILTILSTRVFHSVYAVLFSMTFVIAARSIVSEILLSRMFGVTFWKSIIGETVMVGVFLTATVAVDTRTGFFVYLSALLVYLFLKRATIKHFVVRPGPAKVVHQPKRADVFASEEQPLSTLDPEQSFAQPVARRGID